MDYNAIAKKYGAIDSSTATSTKQKVDYASLAGKFGGKTVTPTTTVSTPAPESGGGVGGFVKGLVEAPATMVARPFQAIQATGQYIQDKPKIDQYETDAASINKENENLVAQMKQVRAAGQDTTAIKNKILENSHRLISIGQDIQPTIDRRAFSGGVVAPVPENFSDVTKDVGRAIQTVALGTGAPIAGGAAFGLGSSVENQGNKIFTGEGLKDAAISTIGGAAAGKLLGLVGKPLLDATGKVIGTITPQIIKDVTARGAGAIEQFAARHEIVPEAARATINKIPGAAEAIDKSLNNIFKGGATAVKGAVQSQYPGMTKENVAKHYEKVELDRLMEPTKVAGKTYNKSADVLKDAEKKGIDLRKVAANNKVYASEHIKDGKFDTTEVADALSNEAMSGGPQVLRPALEAASPGVARVTVPEVRNEMLARLREIPDTKLSPTQKLSAARKIMAEYGDESAFAARHKDGLDLTNLYDSKLQTSGSLYKTPKGGGVQSIKDSLTVQQKQMESQVFGDLLKKRAPKELGIDAYMKAQEGKFALANYLRTLDGNKAPQTIFQRGVKRAAQLGGATTGASVAGPFGMFSGYQFGGIVADTFGNASNPVKVAFLKSIGKTEPEIYQIMKDFVSKSELDKLLRPKLNAPTTIYKGPTQEGKPYTPNRLFGTTPVVETKTVKKK